MQHQHQQQHGRTAAPGHPCQRQAQHGCGPQAGPHRQAQPFPGMRRAITQRSRQRGGPHARQQQQDHGHQALQRRADDAVGQQAGDQRAQHHTHHFGGGHQRLQLHLAHGHPFQKRGVRQQLAQRGLQPLEDLAQAQRHGCRVQQGKRPQHQQRQGAPGVVHEPPLAKPAPAVDQPQLLQRPGQAGPQPATGHIQGPVHIRRHPHGQKTLQGLQQQRQQGHQHSGPQHRPAPPARAHEGQRQQETQGHIPHHIGHHVEPGPVPGQRRHQKRPRPDALVTPLGKRVQAGIDNQRGIHQRQGPG